MPTKEIDVDNLERLEHTDYIDVYLDEDYLNGDVLEVAKKLQEIPERVKKEWKPSHGKKHDYHRIELNVESDYEGYSSVSLIGYYWETDKELADRKAYLKKEEERKKLASEKKKKNKEKNEREEYLRLKAKFGNNDSEVVRRAGEIL